MDKSYRIHTNIISDTMLQVNMKQDFDFLEVLSLKLRQKDAYRIHSSNYGVVVGRVLANDAFGVPNAKVSVFIEKGDGDTTDMEALYPYSKVTTKDKEGRRYNLLPDYSDDDCYRIVGTLPNKRLMLDDDVQLEVFDRYYKFTTVTNNAGDYMLFGIPADTVQVHVDIDLSDIGILSQKPRDFLYKGYNLTEFDSPSQFKESTNLDGLAQIFSQDKSVQVYPFWGDPNNGVACITRSDIQIDYKFEPTCVFMGSIVSDNDGNAIGHKCAPDINSGMNNQLIGGNGTIEMIRKTTDGLVEEYQIQGNQLIDDNGVWCYQIPMNLDYVGTDEYGNVVPTDNPSKGIPTRTQVRFRFSKNETNDEGFSRHTAKYLVPMNPIFSEEQNNIVKIDKGTKEADGAIPVINTRGSDIEQMYVFGSGSPDHCFRDLYWNNVYSVKNYIPKTQISTRAYSKNYNALKGSNLADDQNPIPFNKLQLNMPFPYIIMCILFTMVMYIVAFINEFIICLLNQIIGLLNSILDICIPLGFGIEICPFSFLKLGYIGCIVLSAGISEGNVAYYPGCWCKEGMKASECPEDMEGECEKSDDKEELLDKIQRNLAQEYKIIKLDLYQDWINGCLYMPLWYWRKRKKKSFLFGLFTSRAKSEYCSDSKTYKRLRTYMTCVIRYLSNKLDVKNNKYSMPDDEKRWHKNRKARVNYRRGLIKPVENRDGLTAYYYAALQATSENANPKQEMKDRGNNFFGVRLFATDIILLGNLDPKNLYGIPQFFTCLPSTTANVPPIATVEESNENTDEDDKDKDINDGEDSGTTLTTGMDWNHDGSKQSPKYSSGLFMDLACTYANTKPKTCINVERLSELGVNLDMSYEMPYSVNGASDVRYGTINADGFVTKYELDDMENRAMFATMNHIGFIPQAYQDTIGAYTTQVIDKNTGYFIPKFKYIYPVDFDGRLQIPMELYKNGFEQAMFDERDESYLTFRLGAEANKNKDNNSEGRIRHFYHFEGNLYDMPLYNNSFYFYFGIKKGSTAIDKFNQMFYSPCFKNTKEPFSMVINTHGLSYCPTAYDGANCTNADETDVINRYTYDVDNKNNAYGWIEVKCDDIRTDYSYTLYDSFGDVIITESGMTETKFVIGGGYDDSGNVVSNCSGEVFYQVKNSDGKYAKLMINGNAVMLTNQEYLLKLTDNDGKSITEKIKLDIPRISANYMATRLGTKFYNSATTRIDYICHDDNGFYGKVDMSEVVIDGYSCTITDITLVTYDSTNDVYRFLLTLESSDYISSTIGEVYLEIGVSKTNGGESKVKNCLCDANGGRNEITAAQNASGTMFIDNTKEPYLVSNVVDGVVTFYFYQPNSYTFTLKQWCDGVETNNISTDVITILNGEPFLTYLNKMPTKFMIGTSNDTTAATIGNKSNFYKSEVVKDLKDKNISGWFGLHQEDSYAFGESPGEYDNRTLLKNQDIWEDLIPTITDDITTPAMKRNILKYKFNSMFELCQGAYVTSTSSFRFMFTSTGGVHPILYRTVYPIYSDESKIKDKYLIDDFWLTTLSSEKQSNIVGNNYNNMDWATKTPVDKTTYGGNFNSTIFANEKYVGNYFAAFTRDGGYITKKIIDGDIKIERSPSFASVSPFKGSNPDTPKVKGTDVEDYIHPFFKYAHTKGKQKLTVSGGTKEWNNLPYLRAMYVDRRLDYDLLVLAPAVGSYFDLYPSAEKERERVWKSGRINGWIYNGIEMAYDNDYNVISAKTYVDDFDGDEVRYKAEYNKRLEYSYKYDTAHKCMSCEKTFSNNTNICPYCHEDNVNFFHGEAGGDYNAETKYNTGDTNSVWGEWNSIPNIVEDGSGAITITNYGYDDGLTIDKDDETKPLIKQFYESELCGMDVRHLYWSNFNKERLKKYTKPEGTNAQDSGHGVNAINNTKNPLYVYDYPKDKTDWYNGDFNREDAKNGNVYPTKRFIDVGNLPQINSYGYGITSCDYSLKATIEDDGIIKATSEGGENIKLSFNFEPPITFVSPSEGNTSYANIVYVPKSLIHINKTYKANTVPCYEFTADTISLCFKYNSYSCNGFNTYTKLPRLIKVLPYKNEIDGIGFYKTYNPESEFSGKYGDGKNTVDDALADIVIFSNFDRYVTMPSGISKISGNYRTKQGGPIGGYNYFFKHDGGGFLTSNEEDFTNILFNVKNLRPTSNVKAFTVLIDREMREINDSNLTRHIRVIETSDIIDCRNLVMGILIRDYNNTASTFGTYVMVQKLVSEENDVVTGVTNTPGSTTVPGEGGGSITVPTNEATPSTGSVENSTEMYIQTITFDMFFNLNTVKVEDRENAVFENFEMMSFVFKFKNVRNEWFDITPSEVVEEKDGNVRVIHFVCKWTTNMGIIADTNIWGNKFSCELYAKTSSQFVYKLASFKVQYNKQYGEGMTIIPMPFGYDTELNKLKKDLKDGTKYYTDVIISG